MDKELELILNQLTEELEKLLQEQVKGTGLNLRTWKIIISILAISRYPEKL
ncbi:hypothetical protein D3C86_2263940 [compost metagenome]